MPGNDQLTALDAAFLELEQADDGALMHIGAALVFDALPGGGTPAIGEVREHLEQRLDLLPRYRQKLDAPRTGGLAWPSWERDQPLPTGCWRWLLTCWCRATRSAAASTLTCWSAPSRRSSPSHGWRLDWPLAVRYGLIGQMDEAVDAALAARAIQERTSLSDEWITAAVPMILLRAYTCQEEYEAVEREAAAALADPALAEPVKLVQVRGARALAWFESGHLALATDAARAARGGGAAAGIRPALFRRGPPAALAGLALERRDLDSAEQFAEQAISISERRRPFLEFQALLDRARIWACRGQVRDALATIEPARLVLAGTGSVLLARADELEALLRLSLGDLRSPAELASGLPAVQRALVLARVALASGEYHAARERLQALPPGDLTPRRALEREILLAAAAIGRGDPMTAGVLAAVLDTARREGFLNTVVTTAPQVTGYLARHSAQLRPDPFTEQLISAALEVRAASPEASRPGRALIEPLTEAELRILKLLPTSTYLQMAATHRTNHAFRPSQHRPR